MEYFTFIDNIVRKQQSEGNHIKSHNVLAEPDIVNLYDSRYLSMKHPKRFITRLLFNTNLVTGCRPGEAEEILMKDVFEEEQGGKKCFRIRFKVGSKTGEAETAKGGWTYIGAKPKEIYVWDEYYLDGRVNFYQDIKFYLE